MDGYFVQSGPLTQEGAGALLAIMDAISIPSANASDFLKLRLSVERIAHGVDSVTEVTDS